MKIAKFGTVIIGEGPIRIDGWQMTPEADDPKGATPEQMLLEIVLPWAQEKLRNSVNAAVADAHRRRKAGIKNPTEI